VEVRLRDPENLDFRVEPGFDAEGYGCQSVTGPASAPSAPSQGVAPDPGAVLSGSYITVAGAISEPTTWAADVVRVTGDVLVEAEATLTIAPGTIVEFAGFYRVLVNGRLWAVGEPEQRIAFRPAAGFAAEGWDGVDFHNIPAQLGWSRLEHCLFEGAVARAGEDRGAGATGGTMRPETGGAVSFVGVDKVAVASCDLRGNRAVYGGAVYVGYGASPVLAGNLFRDNVVSLRGSALFSVYSYPKLINNTIVGNVCEEESAFFVCGAVENFNGKIPLINNIIRNNITNHYSGAQVVETKDFYNFGNNLESYAGNATNVDQDPGWAGQGTAPYQLTAGSPGIDRGLDHALSVQLASEDLAGHPRWCGAAIDRGAYEYCGGLTGVVEPAPLALGVGLSCAPNPFNPRTTVSFELVNSGQVSMGVYDLRGLKIRSLAEAWFGAGQHQVVWDGRDDQGQDMGSGVYFIRLVSRVGDTSRRVVLLR
jgi:hypothetical protein